MNNWASRILKLPAGGTTASMPANKQNVIGMLVDDLSDPFFFGVSQSVGKYAALNNYSLICAGTKNKPAVAKKLIRELRSHHVSCYIIAPTTGIEREIQALIDHAYPLVLYDRYLPGIEVPKVTINNYNATFQATRHLIDHGRRNIVFMTPDCTQTHRKERLEGYKDAMAANSLEPCVVLVDYEIPDKTLHRKILKAIQTHLQIDAVLFATHSFTITGLEVLKNMNLVIPVHLAVVGFDDSPHFSFCSPPVTAVTQPINRIASEIARLIFGEIHHSHQEGPPENIVLDTELIIRNSSY